MTWNIAQAKQRLSEVIRLSTQEPQLIYNRGELVAAVIDVHTLELLKSAQAAAHAPTLAEEFASLRALGAEEGYELPNLPRGDAGRSNPFVPMLEEEEAKAIGERPDAH